MSYKFLLPSGLGSYMYIEASDRNVKDKARLISPILQGPQCMTFFYNMFGYRMGSLVMYTRTTPPGGEDRIIWIKSGNRGLSWKQERMSITAKNPYQVIPAQNLNPFAPKFKKYILPTF